MAENFYVGYSELVRYLKENEACSYADFLNCHRDTILTSVRPSDRWLALDSTWSRRFLFKAKELNPANFATLERRVKAECANKGFQEYWEKLIYEKKEMSVNRMHLMNSMDMYGVAGEQNFQKITSRGYLKAFDETGEAEVTTPSKKIKTTLRVEDEPSGSALDDHNEASPSNGHDESEKDINCSELPQTDAEINAEGLDDGGQMSASDYEIFRQKYNSMETSKKWRLSTGTAVEDKLYNFGMKCTREHLSHSFILDPDDENFLNEGVFTEGELAEIRKFQAKPLPTMPKELLTYLNSFRPGTTAELRKLVFRQEAMDQNFDRQKDFDRDWIRNTVYNLLREYEAESLKKDHLELWLLLHVWSFIDKAFENLGDVEAVRGESCSLASSERKNKKRTVSAIIKVKRKKLGRKGDLIIRKISSEYGCSEAGMFYKGQNDTKLLRERGLKTPKMMKDMFCRLCESVGWVEQKIRKVETIGFLHAGLMMMMLRLDSPSGYVCRISRSKSLSIPSLVEEFGAKALPCILLAWMAKTIVANAICLVEEDENNVSEVSEEDQLQQLLTSCEASNIISPPSPKRAETHLPHFPGNSNTPSKKQRVLLFDQDQLGPPIPFKLTQKKVAK